MHGNADRLRDEGLIADTPLPDHYYEMIDGLTGDEVEVLLSLKRRLDDAGIPTGPLQAPRPGDKQSIVIL